MEFGWLLRDRSIFFTGASSIRLGLYCLHSTLILFIDQKKLLILVLLRCVSWIFLFQNLPLISMNFCNSSLTKAWMMYVFGCKFFELLITERRFRRGKNVGVNKYADNLQIFTCHHFCYLSNVRVNLFTIFYALQSF